MLPTDTTLQLPFFNTFSFSVGPPSYLPSPALFFLPSSSITLSVCFLCGAQHYNILTVCIDRQAPRTAFNLTFPPNPDPIEHTHTPRQERMGALEVGSLEGEGKWGTGSYFTQHIALVKNNITTHTRAFTTHYTPHRPPLRL